MLTWAFIAFFEKGGHLLCLNQNPLRLGRKTGVHKRQADTQNQGYLPKIYFNRVLFLLSHKEPPPAHWAEYIQRA